MNTLHLPLKKQWYEMIESGIKTEEYREIKPFYCSRLLYTNNGNSYEKTKESDFDVFLSLASVFGGRKTKEKEFAWHIKYGLEKYAKYAFRDYTHVKFSYGYTKRTMTFEVQEISIGKGNPEWGAESNKYYFIIKLGKRICSLTN